MSIYGIKYDVPVNRKKVDKFDFNSDKNRKLNMFKQCSKNIKPSTENNTINNNNDFKRKPIEDKELLEEIKKLKNDLKAERNKRKDLDKINKDLKKKISVYNKEVYDLKNENESLNQDIQSYKEIIDIKNREIIDLNKLKKENENIINQFSKKIISLRTTNNNLKKEKNNLNRKIKEYSKFEIEGVRVVKSNEILNLYADIKHTKQKYNKLLSNYEALLNAENDKNTTDIIEEYTLKENKKEYIGYLKLKDSEYTFISDDIKIKIDGLGLPDGTICKVLYKDDEYKIIKLFDELGYKNNFSKKVRKTIRRNKLVQKIANKYPKFNTDKKVLIINTRFKNIYINGFRELDLNVSFATPKEESIYRICSKLDKYDIVILCVGHLGHDLTNAVNKCEVNNVFELRNDTFNNMVYMINYALENIKEV